MSERTPTPQLLEESEALIGAPFFFDPESYDTEGIFTDELGFKQFIYQACCKIMATARYEDREIARHSPGYETVSWNERWELTMRKMAEIAFRNFEDVSFLSRQLALVNNASRYAEMHWDTIKERLYEDQQQYMFDIINALQGPPKTLYFTDDDGNRQHTNVLGITAVAPTGFGKTRLMETCALMFQAGKSIEASEYGQDPCRIIWVTPSRVILRQTAEQLRKTFPELTIGTMSGDSRQGEGDIIVTTTDMFIRHFEANYFADWPIDVVMIDEVHHLQGPQFKKTFLEQWQGLTLGFTATPAYNIARDVRSVIPHAVERVDTLELIEQGRLNDGQIFTFSIQPEILQRLIKRYGLDPEEYEERIAREVIDRLVVEFVTPLIDEGRRGIIFCEGGNQAQYANSMAERLRQVELEDGRTIRAEAMHSYSEKDSLQLFREGELDVLTTVDTGREGLDAGIDFVIINCNLISRLRGRQIIGRGTRPSEEFPVTIYAQFMNLSDKSHERLFTIEEAFGSHVFEQGKLISDRRKGNDVSQSKEPKLRGPLGPNEPRAINLEYSDEISRYDAIIQDILNRIDRRPVGEVCVGPNRGAWQVEEGMIPLHELIKDYNVSETRAKIHLRKAGFQWRGKFEKVNNKSKLCFYYFPEVIDYLDATLPKHSMRNVHEIAQEHDIPLSLVKHLLNEHNITGRKQTRTKGKPSLLFTLEEQEIIIAAAKETIGMRDGDGFLQDIVQELGLNKESVLTRLGLKKVKRVLINGRYPLTREEIQKIRNEHNTTETSRPGEKSLREMAEMAGVDHQIITRTMRNAEKAMGKEKYHKNKRGSLCIVKVWPEDIAAGIIERAERLRARKLPAHLLPVSALKAIIAHFATTPTWQLQEELQNAGMDFEGIVIEKTRNTVQCVSWPAIKHLQSIMGTSRSRRALNLDYARLPTGPEDRDPTKIAYAQEIQRLFLKDDQLEDYS